MPISKSQEEKMRELTAQATSSLRRSPAENAGTPSVSGQGTNQMAMVGGSNNGHSWVMPVLVMSLVLPVFGWVVWLLGPMLLSAVAGGNERPLTRPTALILIVLFGTAIWVSALLVRQVWKTKKL